MASPAYTQTNRLLSIETPLGPDVLLLQEISGHEGISRLFSYELDLLAYANDSISFKDLVGQKVTVTIQLPDGSPRYINGYVSRFTQGATDDRYFTHYHAQVVPWLWFLTRQADCRIYQNLAPPDIISQVLNLSGVNDFKMNTTGSYPTLEYCVQYRETAFNFISRLMEEYGIFYYFDHTTQGKHTMVLADQSSTLTEISGSPFSYDTQVGGFDSPDVITAWNVQQELQTGKYTMTDYNFITPSTSLLSSNPTVVQLPASDGLELFDYPGRYTTKEAGLSLTKVRMEEEEAVYLVTTGSSNCRAFASGFQFDLENHYRGDQNSTYVITEVQHFASAGQTYTSDKSESETYSNHFSCILASTPYRPPRVTPKPFVQGPQPALVVGKEGEEIWVDNYGRVKVQFYWDRQGQQNENSSCWIRVSQPWAGGNWGAMWIPRIGQEVIVSFLEGDPDRPIITGRVYNAAQMPPYALPGNQTRSTFMSRSSKGGSASNFNELRFEDLKGSEQVFVNAEKDMDLRVENDSREYIGASRHLIVNTNQTEQVVADKHGQVGGSHFESITGDMNLQVGGKQLEKVAGDQSIQVGGDQKEQVTGSASLTVGQDQKESVGGGFSLNVGQASNVSVGTTHAMNAGQTIHLKGGMTVIIEAGMELSLKAAGGFIDIGPAGVAISGTMVMINSGGAAGSAADASPQSPASPDAPTASKGPDTADDGSKGTWFKQGSLSSG